MKNNVKLLWIDDMVEWATSAQGNLEIVANLKGIKLHTVTATNGEEVVQQLMMFDFDCVIMDYNMEPFLGDKYISDIRNEEHLEDIPIIFYSQDNSTNLADLVKSFKNVEVVYRPNLEDKIKELFF